MREVGNRCVCFEFARDNCAIVLTNCIACTKYVCEEGGVTAYVYVCEK